MLLQNSIIQLRALEPEDLDILYRWENDASLWVHGCTVSPYSKLALRQYINDSAEMDVYLMKQLRLMICAKETDEPLGTIDLYEIDIHNKRAGIGILIDEAYRNKGYASMALKLMHAYTFDFLDLHHLFAHITTQNEISLQLFAKEGYKDCGVLKDWVRVNDHFEDVQVMQLIKKQ